MTILESGQNRFQVGALTTYSGPLTVLIDCAGPWIAWAFVVRLLRLSTICDGDNSAAMGPARAKAETTKLRKETIMAE
jgi:hypothetical protein